MHSPGRSLVALALISTTLSAAHAQQSGLVRDGVALTDPRIASELPGYLNAQAEQFVDWLADGTLLVIDPSQRIRQVQHVRAALSPLQQLSSASSGVVTAVARPYTSDAFVYVASSAKPAADANDTDPAQLFLQQTGVPAHLLADSRVDRGAPAWAHDGRRIAFSGAGETGVYVLDTSTAGALPRLVVSASDGRWHVLGWSIDDRALLLGRERNVASADTAHGDGAPRAADVDRSVSPVVTAGAAASEPSALSAPLSAANLQLELYLADTGDGSLSPVPAFGARRTLRHSARASNPTPAAIASAARFASDGRSILLLTQQACQSRDVSAAHEFAHLCLTDPADGDWRQLSGSEPHDVELFGQSADGSVLAYTLNDEGSSRLVLIDQQRQYGSAAAQLGPGVITALKFDPTGQRLAMTFESARSAPDAYVLEARTGAVTRWTRSDAGVPDSAGFVQPQLAHFPTWDEIDGQPRQLSALLYAPSGADIGGRPRPVVVWLCSGEGQQCRPRYQPFVQFLVRKLGFAVIAPNVRGTPGFGTSFEAAGVGALQDDAARDIGSLLVWIGLQPGLDHGRIALLGEGFGSYLALTSLSQFGDRLSGAVAAFPGRPWSLANALAIQRPVLLVQGLADPRVPPYQAAQLREGLRASGVPVQYLAADDERGRFERAGSIEAYYEAAATFLERLVR